jgi:hypothetical protein
VWQEIGLRDYIQINLSTKTDKIMEPQKKNRPNSLVLILFALVILMIIIYFILVLFFPTVFDLMNTGDIKPVAPDK